VPMHGLYRWHLMDPIRFERELRVTIQQIGHNSRSLFERSDDISSVALVPGGAARGVPGSSARREALAEVACGKGGPR